MQADKPSFFIDIEKFNFDNNEHDFNYESVVHDTVFRIKRDEIIEKAKKKYTEDAYFDTIKYLNLIIVISTKEIDTYYLHLLLLKYLCLQKEIINIK